MKVWQVFNNSHTSTTGFTIARNETVCPSCLVMVMVMVMVKAMANMMAVMVMATVIETRKVEVMVMVMVMVMPILAKCDCKGRQHHCQDGSFQSDEECDRQQELTTS